MKKVGKIFLVLCIVSLITLVVAIINVPNLQKMTEVAYWVVNFSFRATLIFGLGAFLIWYLRMH